MNDMNENTPRRVTQAEIAKRAQVSRATASLALRNSPRISIDTRARIARIARELGYTPLPEIDGRGTDQHTVGFVLIGNPDYQTYHKTFHVTAVESRLQGQHLLFHPVALEDELDLELLEKSGCSGFILMGAAEDRHYNAMLELEKPIVVVGEHRVSSIVHGVKFDNFQAGEVAVRYLAACGHRRITFTVARDPYIDAAKWSHGYSVAMADLKLPPDLVEVPWKGDETVDGIREILTRNSPPTAIVTSSPYARWAALTVAAELGVRVPEDLSVLGFGPLWNHSNPAATEMDVPLETFGKIILRRINELIEYPDDFPLTVMLNLVLEDNGTCGPVPE
jgi:DNA-binding LacI/PurR family transcriptional regulator